MTTTATKPTAEQNEKRSIGISDLEIRVEQGKPTRLIGYAAKFGVRSQPIYGAFREVIAKGAFGKNLPGADIRFLVGHDTRAILGRTKSGTMKVTEDDIGLRFDLTLPETTLAKDTIEQINRRDLDAMSFGFKKVEDAWGEDEEGFDLRTLKEVKVFELSLTAFPAYDETEVALRDLAAWREKKSHSRRSRLRLRLTDQGA